MTPRTSRSIRPMALVAVAALALAGCSAGSAPTSSVIMLDPAATNTAMGVRETTYNPAKPAPPLQLTDQDGQPFSLASQLGTPVFVYFGYTHCADVCPTTLADLRAALQTSKVPAKVVFVTVDPARDTAPALKAYLAAYNAGFIGLTGTADQIAAAAKAWSVTYYAEPADSGGNYDMVHTSDVFLVDAQGVLRNHIFFGAGSSLIASILEGVSGGSASPGASSPSP